MSEPSTNTATDVRAGSPEPSRETLERIARQWWQAVEASNPDVLAELMADDMTWEIMHVGSLMSFGGLYRGREMVMRELVAVSPKLYYAPGNLKIHIDKIYVDDPTVILEFTLNAKTISGISMSNAKYVSIMIIEGGKVSYVREYPDAPQALGHFGAP